jgi:mono/diheme cytochrome c family protein
LLAAIGCGSARRSEPLVGAFTPASAAIERGERVFMANCHPCHPGGEAGLGPALNDKPLPGALIRLQVRAGLGAMPAFAATEIADADLDALLAYLRARR